MKFKRLFNTTAIALLVLMVFLGLASHDSVVAAQDASSKIESTLLDQFSIDNSADYIIRFADQADLSAAYAMDWDTRGEYVYHTLLEKATTSQVNAKAMLEKDGLKFQTFIGGNELYVWGGSLASVNSLATLPEVGFIRAPQTYTIDPTEVVNSLQGISWAGDYLAKFALTTVGNGIDATTDWGILDSNADQFWTTFTVKGDGMVVANIDTGVQWNHPALDQSFKCGTDPTDPACWDDPSNICGGSACDNHGHGTHTMGTMVADDDPSLSYIAGMAPNAQWIACKGCESNTCSEFALTACADWILAPDENPANRPDVVNNSWGDVGGDAWYQSYVQAWVAAGIFPAFSAGNLGSSCSTLGSPGDYQESFGSAAHDVNRNIASFSSRGPSAVFGHEPYTKPNISAPGVSIWSSYPNNTWAPISGTSMASPHSAGAVALLWSCNPDLVGQVDLTFQILQDNADAAPAGNCGAPADGEGNYTFGYGYLNVLAAGMSSCSDLSLGTLQGYVTDKGDNPIEGARVTATPSVEGNQVQALTNPDGFYTMDLVAGTYNVTASKVGYQPSTVNDVIIEEGVTRSQDFNLNYVGSWTQIALPPGCPDYTRFDAEYYPGTGLVYILGGRGGSDGGSTYGDVYAFNPHTNTCTDTSANLPNPVSNYTINLVNDGSADLLCIFGGRTASGASTMDVQCYDPNSNTASVVTSLPTGYTNYTPGAQVVVENMVYIFGGFNPDSAPYDLARTDRYDPVANSFTQLGDLSQARSYIDAAVVDGKIYAFGGTVFDGANLNAQTRTEVMADPGGAGTWDNAAVAELPTATAEGRAFGFDTNTGYGLAGEIVVAAGGQWPGESLEAFTYNVASNTYDYSFPDLNSSRRDNAGFFVPGVPGSMWVFGGRTGGVDIPPYASPEYFSVPNRSIKVFLPMIVK
jgi:hypothetical protein